MSVVVDSRGAQVLPAVGDQRASWGEWVALLASDADQRTKYSEYRELAASLFVRADRWR